MNFLLYILFILLVASNRGFSLEKAPDANSHKRSETERHEAKDGIQTKADNAWKGSLDEAAQSGYYSGDDFTYPKDYDKRTALDNEERAEAEPEYTNADEDEEDDDEDESIFTNTNNENNRQLSDVQEADEENIKFSNHPSKLEDESAMSRQPVKSQRQFNIISSPDLSGDTKAKRNYDLEPSFGELSKSLTSNCRGYSSINILESMNDGQIKFRNPETSHERDETSKTKPQKNEEDNESDNVASKVHTKSDEVDENGYRSMSIKRLMKGMEPIAKTETETQAPLIERVYKAGHTKHESQDLNVKDTESGSEKVPDALDRKTLSNHKKLPKTEDESIDNITSAEFETEHKQKTDTGQNEESNTQNMDCRTKECEERDKSEETMRPFQNKWSPNTKGDNEKQTGNDNIQHTDSEKQSQDTIKCHGDSCCSDRRTQFDSKHHCKSDSCSNNKPVDSQSFQHPIPGEENERTERPLKNSARKESNKHGPSPMKEEVMAEKRKFPVVEKSSRNYPSEGRATPFTGPNLFARLNSPHKSLSKTASGLLERDTGFTSGAQTHKVLAKFTDGGKGGHQVTVDNSESDDDLNAPLSNSQDRIDNNKWEERAGKVISYRNPQISPRNFEGANHQGSLDSRQYKLPKTNSETSETEPHLGLDKNGNENCKMKLEQNRKLSIDEDNLKEMKAKQRNDEGFEHKELQKEEKSKFFSELIEARNADGTSTGTKEETLKTKLKALGDMLHSNQKIPPYKIQNNKNEVNDEEEKSQYMKYKSEPDPVKDWWDLTMEPQEGKTASVRPMKKIEAIQHMMEHPLNINSEKKNQKETFDDEADNGQEDRQPSDETRRKLDEFIRKLQMTGELYCLHNKGSSGCPKYDSHDRFNSKKGFKMKHYFFNGE